MAWAVSQKAAETAARRTVCIMKQPTACTTTTSPHEYPSAPTGIGGGGRRVVRPVHQAGFTLIELVMIIVLIGVLAVYTLPKFDYSGPQVAAASRKLIEDLRYAQSLAVNTQIRHGVVFSSCSGGSSGCVQYQVTQFDKNWNQAQFDASGNSLTQCYQNDSDQILVNCQQVLDPLTGQPMIVQMTGSTQGVTVGTTLNGLTIQFDDSGTPWAGQGPLGTQHVPLQNNTNNTLTIQSGTCSASLTVTTTTGLVGPQVSYQGTTTPEVQCT